MNGTKPLAGWKIHRSPVSKDLPVRAPGIVGHMTENACNLASKQFVFKAKPRFSNPKTKAS